MNNSRQLDQNEKLLVQAFNLQNQEAYDKAFEQLYYNKRKLVQAGDNLIKIIEKIQSSPEFYMKYMQLMKEEREMISQKDYKEFLAKNQKVLSKNFEKNAYLALLMQEIQQKQSEQPPKKMTNKQINQLKKMVQKNASWEDILKKFPKIMKEELKEKYQAFILTHKKSDNFEADYE